MGDSGLPPPNRPSRGSGSLTVHLSVELDEGILKIAGERITRQQGKRHYHSMEVQIGPFERRFRLPVVVDPASIRATYEHGFLEIRLAKQPPRSSGAQSVRVT